MTHAIRVLRAEHEKLAKLLRLMDCLHEHMVEGQSPDFHLLDDIGNYLTGFPDQCHHPKEDLIYRRLEKRDPAHDEGAAHLVHEHEELSELTQGYVRLLAEAKKKPEAPTGEFLAGMKHLINYYKHHMAMEETYFFPAALELLTADDWAEVNYAVSEQVDPLFDAAIEKFDRLRDEIFRLADDDDKRLASRTHVDHIADELSDLQTADQLNAILKEQYPDCRLIKVAGDGFRLNDRDSTILEIPECDEIRATWCAYCFLKGRFP